jgi:hypothetical protein
MTDYRMYIQRFRPNVQSQQSNTPFYKSRLMMRIFDATHISDHVRIQTLQIVWLLLLVRVQHRAGSERRIGRRRHHH